MPRVTFKTWLGDYGVAPEFEKLNEYELIQKLANKLGKYEDKEQEEPDAIQNALPQTH